MILDTSLESGHAIERYRAAFRADVAEQLRLAAERAGLAPSVAASEAKIVLEIAGCGSDGESLRVVVRFNDAREAMPCWVDWVATITASDKGYLDGAQEWFPKGAVVLAHEKALAAAKQDRDGAEQELARLDGKPDDGTAALIADAKSAGRPKSSPRWRNAGKNRETQRAAADAVKQTKDRMLSEDFALRQAVDFDASRLWAWRSLFLIFGVINFAGPFAISRILEKWRTDHGTAKKDARDDHKFREASAVLRHNRATQKARAMLLLPAALSELVEEGISARALQRLDQVDVAEKAAERFDRSVNRQEIAAPCCACSGLRRERRTEGITEISRDKSGHAAFRIVLRRHHGIRIASAEHRNNSGVA